MSFEYDQQNNSLRDTKTSQVYSLKNGFAAIDKNSEQLIYLCSGELGVIEITPDTIDYICTWDNYGDLSAQLKERCNLSESEQSGLDRCVYNIATTFSGPRSKYLNVLKQLNSELELYLAGRNYNLGKLLLAMGRIGFLYSKSHMAQAKLYGHGSKSLSLRKTLTPYFNDAFNSASGGSVHGASKAFYEKYCDDCTAGLIPEHKKTPVSYATFNRTLHVWLKYRLSEILYDEYCEQNQLSSQTEDGTDMFYDTDEDDNARVISALDALPKKTSLQRAFLAWHKKFPL